MIKGDYSEAKEDIQWQWLTHVAVSFDKEIDAKNKTLEDDKYYFRPTKDV